MRAIRRFTVRTVLPAPLEPLGELAMNLRWSWHAETRDLFESIDPETWAAVGQDPVRLLGAVPTDKLAALAEDRRFLARLTVAAEDLNHYLTGARWYQSLPEPGTTPDAAPAAIAYFSPEFGITAALPQYSGGLGILAGDHLKAASDLGVPIIGVGLLYKHGYFRQSLSRDGWQQERYPLLDPNELPLTLLRRPDGDPARVLIGLPGGRELHARIWKAQVGRVPLLLLDSDIEDNEPFEREVTDRLYGGTSEHRLHQEMLLGIGGVRAVREFCALTGHARPEVFHTNEGHAGFLGVERIREFHESDGLDFDAALEAVRAGTVFTTHTPVPAGIDRFDRELIARHFGGDNANAAVPVDRVLALGAETFPGGEPGVFNMAVMGLRLAQRANGVSELHGHVSQGMFAGLWPGFDAEEVPIGSITNGVHAPTWVDRDVLDLAAREIGHQLTEEAHGWSAIEQIPARSVWELRRTLRAKLVTEARARLRASWKQRGAGDAELGWTEHALDPDILTIGFARRVPSYKRLTLMLRDQDRLRGLLLHPTRPIQIVVAGKAHPADEGGKRLVQELVKFSDGEDVRHRIVFLPDYDIAMAQHLYPGCDVWLNNPLRPLEACGTSGMKAALNGCLNLSILDGWWDEWYDGSNGWAIPTADGVEDPDRRDDLEANALYDLVEHNVAARFYDRGTDGLPSRWLEMVRHTLVSLGPKVLASRMVKDYVNTLYAPAALAARAMAADDLAGAKTIAHWKAEVRGSWPQVRVDHVESGGIGDAPEVGNTLDLRVFVSLGELRPSDVEVQVVHGRVDGSDAIVDGAVAPLKPVRRDEHGRWLYEGSLALDRTGPFGYSVRVMPAHTLLASPAELGLIAVPEDGEGVADGLPLR
ncbi:alpha-glucan family phosphorylase [Yinghuangia seranimata]|uniref:alpha-glucan family phosphorylase n=1 Tax=Yinghuangia seranimata TaxID=408067 RepID=UPI00248CCABD|nr:alpha-glucan family phosphorylase [Yinghuangia seranimata]MDI2128258.1 alpha-glucan family phosphorylase [Yinghuangia seranimata]